MYQDQKDNAIKRLSFDFALMIVEFTELLESRKKFIVARQLLKSGTSIGANIFEAQNAESKADFYHKFKIAAKEMEECDFWLQLCKYAPSYPDPDKLLSALPEIRKVISKILSTIKKQNNIQEPEIEYFSLTDFLSDQDIPLLNF
jgi:four helix bundle protein